MNQSSKLSLSSFYIFNSNFGPKEGQEERKVLFYYPYVSSADARIKDVGICEAIIKFSNTFAATENSCQVMRTQKTLQLFHQPEPDYWMIMCLKVPYEKSRSPHPDTPSGALVTEYRGENVHEKIYRAVLEQAYRQFRLFTGTFASHFDGDGVVDYECMPVRLMEALNDFYTKYIKSLRLDRCDILDVFRSIQYLPVDRLLFLHIHTFVRIVQARFPAIRHCILLYDEQLVWSDINPHDMYAVYEYLTTQVFPHTVKSIARSAPLDEPNPHCHYGTFVTAPPQFQNSVAIPRVHVYNGGGGEAGADQAHCEVFDLIVYRSGGTAIGMFFDDSAERTDDTYHELHTFLGPQLATIGGSLADCGSGSAFKDASDNNSALNGPRYLFFNELNLRHTGTLHLNSARPPKQSDVPAEVMNLLTDLYNESAGSSETDGGGGAAEETVIKTLNDYWIVRRSCNWRHCFVVVNKSSTLLSVSQEARQIFDEHAGNVFFDK